ncbi:hypothetical protein BBJ28_00005994 [Nothophytophthora sp. Chile5]|nr:hypothetical protein BBJ28_00005994 [Nothophytophthora sp. Chile5]
MAITQSSLALLVIIAAGLADSSEAAGKSYTQSADYLPSVLSRVNHERAVQGLSPLCSNEKLQAAAQGHADDMSENVFVMWHTGVNGSTTEERISNAGYNWKTVSENVAAGQKDVDAVVDAWMDSENDEDTANLLGNFTMFGVAYAYRADSPYKHYWTLDFATSNGEACGSTKEDDIEQNMDAVFGEA